MIKARDIEKPQKFSTRALSDCSRLARVQFRQESRSTESQGMGWLALTDVRRYFDVGPHSPVSFNSFRNMRWRLPVTSEIHSRVDNYYKYSSTVLAHNLTTNERKKYHISINPEMGQVLITTKYYRVFHFAPCSTSNLLISSHRP